MARFHGRSSREKERERERERQRDRGRERERERKKEAGYILWCLFVCLFFGHSMAYGVP